MIHILEEKDRRYIPIKEIDENYLGNLVLVVRPEDKPYDSSGVMYAWAEGSDENYKELCEWGFTNINTTFMINNGCRVRGEDLIFED